MAGTLWRNAALQEESVRSKQHRLMMELRPADALGVWVLMIRVWSVKAGGQITLLQPCSPPSVSLHKRKGLRSTAEEQQCEGKHPELTPWLCGQPTHMCRVCEKKTVLGF